MKCYKSILKLLLIILGLIQLIGMLTTSATAREVAKPLAVSDSIQIYYKLTSTGSCLGPVSLSYFIKRTLAQEVSGSWPAEALKANAIASRSFTISANSSEIYQNTYCTHAWKQKGFLADKPLNDNINAAVDVTNGVIMTHPNASTILGTNAIEARYAAENGSYTQKDPSYAWLKDIYDPISAGQSASNPNFHYDMAQNGSKRWASGMNASGEAFPIWDYRRILAHYYTGIEFIGITNPNPPEGFRANMLKIEGISAAGFTMCRGEERTGIRVLYQNTGQWD